MTDEPRRVTLADVEAAGERLEGVVKRTPVDDSRTFAERSGAEAVWLKLETLQRTGSFKLRGAYNTLATLSAADRERGVVAASGGNHAQGVARAAELLGIDATIVMPTVTPMAKVEATSDYGAEVVIHGDIYQESHERALALAEEEGRTLVPPFDHPAVIAGQGTMGLELAEQVPDLETVVVAIGGGGLISGVGTALTGRLGDVRVVGVQTEGCSHMAESLERGEIYERDSIDTITEGIAASRTEALTFAHVRELVDEVVTVTDREVTRALALLAERNKLVAETAGVVALAAICSDALDVTGERVAVPICGGNIDLPTFAAYVETGLAHEGRIATLQLTVSGWPTAVGRVAETVEQRGASLLDLRRTGVDPTDPNRTIVTVRVAGSGPDHLSALCDALGALDGVTVLERD